MNRKPVRKVLTLLLVPMIAAVLLTRLFLFLVPGAGGGFAGIHVHHLLIGVLLMAVGGVPAILTQRDSRIRGPAVGVFGFGLGLAVDEWLLLVVRESIPEESYQSMTSIIGAATLTALVVAYTLWVNSATRRDG